MILNRKIINVSVVGYDLNFQFLNISGFSAYTFYTFWGYFWPN